MNSSSCLLIASSNRGKFRELRMLLSDLPLTLLTLHEFPTIEPIQETGSTFVENASLKAAGYASQARLLTLADDSGLEVDALGGAPGVRSARYVGGQTSDDARMKALLAKLATVEPSHRTSRFVSAVAIASRDGEILNVSLGTCEGRIALAPRGAGGFGYDPLFIPNGYDLTFAELNAEIKNQISHRAQALTEARAYLQSLTISFGAG